MAEPTLALTFNDYILRVAEYLGVSSYAGGTAAIPTDAHDLEVCKRVVNDGWRRFYNSHADWNWVNQMFTITFDPDATDPLVNVDGENWRYYMPEGFYGLVIAPFTYAENSGRIDILQVPEDLIRSKYAQSTVSGYPTEYAMRPLSGDDARRWEVIFWPQPSSALVVTGRIAVYPNKLTELTDQPNAGFQFDEAILAACMAEAEIQREDTAGLMDGRWKAASQRAVNLDKRSAPKSLGDYGSGNPRYHGRIYDGVDTYTNMDGTVHTFTT